MKSIFVVVSMFLLSSVTVLGQKAVLHTPADILKIMTDSKVSYSIRMLDTTIPPKDRSEQLNFNDVYRVQTKSGFATRKYEPSEMAKRVFEKAEEFFIKNDLISARLFYKQAIEADSTFYKSLTYIGQTYGIEGNTDEAIRWYKQAIAKNYIDYMAHWFLADMYAMKNQNDLALDEILTAHILNRNNPRIIDAMKAIVKQNKKEYANWAFTPQYSLQKYRDDSIEIAMNAQWIGYANAKACWAFEPGFKESMGFEKDQSFIQGEEKDALLGLVTMMKADKKVTPTDDIRAADKAIEKKYITEFIFYEIYLPKAPAIAYQLPDDLILTMKKYIKDIRLK